MGLLRLATETALVAPDITVMDAVRVMTERHVGAVAVTEGRRCVGMFTERDLMRRCVAAGRDVHTTRVREVMSAPVVSVSARTPVSEAANTMREHHIRHLAVVDAEGNLEGVVALRYLLYAMMDDLEAKVGDLEGFLMADAPGG
jgi:CBS domain-containing protein